MVLLAVLLFIVEISRALYSTTGDRKLMRYAAICFDMDGTLVESENVWEKVEGEMLLARGIVYTDEIRQQVIGLRLDEFFGRLKGLLNLSESVPELIAELEERMTPAISLHVKPKKGAQALIDYTRSLGVPYCIASASSLSIINTVVKAMGWDETIRQRYSANSVPRGKPAPDVYLYAAEQLGVAPQDCLAIEDSLNGTKSALAAGMTTVVIPDFHTAHSAFEGLGAHMYADLDEVLLALQTGAL
jgi:HAD superfamily hydrolase (TIGR01509 family)